MPDPADERPTDETAGKTPVGEPLPGQSGAGVISCLLFALVVAMVLAFRVLRPGEGAPVVTRSIRLLQVISVRVAFFAVLLGVVFGLYGIVQRGRKRALAVVGLLLNGAPFALVLVKAVARALH